jgi:PII-like signaling protein
VHTSKIFELAGELPMVIEIVEITEKIEEFLSVVETLLRESGAQALVTRESVRQWTT